MFELPGECIIDGQFIMKRVERGSKSIACLKKIWLIVKKMNAA